MIESPICAESYEDILRFVGVFDVLFAEEHPILPPSS